MQLWNDIDSYNHDRIGHLVRRDGYEVIVMYANVGKAFPVDHGPLLENGRYHAILRDDVTDVTDATGSGEGSR